MCGRASPITPKSETSQRSLTIDGVQNSMPPIPLQPTELQIHLRPLHKEEDSCQTTARRVRRLPGGGVSEVMAVTIGTSGSRSEAAVTDLRRPWWSCRATDGSSFPTLHCRCRPPPPGPRSSVMMTTIFSA
jgi:hypothetical protein